MARHWNMRGFGRFVIVRKATGLPLGHVGALQLDPSQAPDMNWTIWDQVYEGRGYTFESAQAYLSHASGMLECKTRLIRVAKGNQRSLRRADRIGATRHEDALAREWMPDAVTLSVAL